MNDLAVLVESRGDLALAVDRRDEVHRSLAASGCGGCSRGSAQALSTRWAAPFPLAELHVMATRVWTIEAFITAALRNSTFNRRGRR